MSDRMWLLIWYMMMIIYHISVYYNYYSTIIMMISIHHHVSHRKSHSITHIHSTAPRSIPVYYLWLIVLLVSSNQNFSSNIQLLSSISLYWLTQFRCITPLNDAKMSPLLITKSEISSKRSALVPCLFLSDIYKAIMMMMMIMMMMTITTIAIWSVSSSGSSSITTETHSSSFLYICITSTVTFNHSSALNSAYIPRYVHLLFYTIVVYVSSLVRLYYSIASLICE
jgi:hypothetical protein